MILSISAVTKSYQTAEGRLPILKGIDLNISAGESVALTGESGSGKSTLLHLAGGLDSVDTGKIVANGVNITEFNEAERAEYRRTQAGLIFQQYNLIPSLTVEANLHFHAKLADRYDARWSDSLSLGLGLQELLGRYPDQLSGGQQQRVAIGRTLAARPPLVLADEPTGNLDEATGDAVLQLMLSLSKESGSALLMVTHSTRLAAKLDRTITLSSGRIIT